MRKSPTAPKPAFQIPTIEEVRAFINLCKPDWPTAFVEYLAARWMDHYKANGFVVGRVKMKDWKACVRGQWLQLKYKEDRDRLEADLKSWQHRILVDEKKRKSAGLFAVVEGSGPTHLQRFLESLDAVFALYQTGQASDSQLRKIAEWLDRSGFQGVTPAQMDRIIAERGNSGDYGKILIARQFFANLLSKGWTISDYVRSKAIPNQQIKTA